MASILLGAHGIYISFSWPTDSLTHLNFDVKDDDHIDNRINPSVMLLDPVCTRTVDSMDLLH